MAEALSIDDKMKPRISEVDEELYRLPPPLKEQENKNSQQKAERYRELNEDLFKIQRLVETLELVSDLKDPDVEKKLVTCNELQEMKKMELEHIQLTADEDFKNNITIEGQGIIQENNEPFQKDNIEQDYLQKKGKTVTETKNMQNIKNWENIVSDLTNDEIEVLRDEIQEGLERAMKANVEKAKRGRAATRPKIQLNTIRNDREKIGSRISRDRGSFSSRDTSSDWIDEYNKKYTKQKQMLDKNMESPQTSTPRKNRSNSLISVRQYSKQNIPRKESSVITPIKTDDLAYSLANAMKSVGMGGSRNVPEPEPFQLGTGQKINKFFKIFERYCEHQYSNDKSDWIKVLGKYLQGEIKSVYEAVKIAKDDYQRIKARILDYYQMNKEKIDTDRKSQFEQAKMKPGELIGIYALRLESLAEKAYPNVPVENNKDLRKKFIKTVPEYFANQLYAHNTVTKGCTGRDLLWDDIVKLATLSQSEIENIQTGTAYEMYYGNEIKSKEPTHGVNSQMTEYKNTKINNKKSNYLFQEPKGNNRMFNKKRYNAKYEINNNYNNVKQNEYNGNSNINSKQGHVNTDQVKNGFQNRQRYFNSTNKVAETCNYCKKLNHQEKDCRIKHRLCFKCGGTNHISRHCTQRNNKGFSNSYNQYTTNRQTNTQTTPNLGWKTTYVEPTPEGGLTPLNPYAST